MENNTGMRRVEVTLERSFFFSRWFAAPVYFGLTMGLLVMVAKFFQITWSMVSGFASQDIDDVVVTILQLLDITMVINMILIVMFAGYENFVSKLDVTNHPDYPQWMTHVTFGDIKLKILASIVVMSGIHLLADFFRIDDLTDRKLAWSVIIHIVFLVSAWLMAKMDSICEPRDIDTPVPHFDE